MALDVDALAAEVVTLIAQAITPLQAKIQAQHDRILTLEVRSERLTALETRMAAVRDGAPGIDGKDADAELVAHIVTARVGALVSTEVERAVGLVPTGKDGERGPVGEPGPAGEPGPPGPLGPVGEKGQDGAPGELGRDGLPGQPGEDGAAGTDGRDGADAPPLTREALMDAILAMPDVLEAAVVKHLTAHPPRDGHDGVDGIAGAHGKDGTPGRDGVNGIDGAPGLPGKDGLDGIHGLHGKDGADGRHGIDGKDGVGLAGAVLARDGALVVTLTDGNTRELGAIVGTDGAPGPAGRDGVDGTHGKDGSDGRDGLGFDDMVVEQDGDRGVVVKLIQGERVKTFGPFVFPVLVYKGVWVAGQTYEYGQTVTWGGSMWHANKETTAKPGDGSSDWTLSVKKGSDGKEGKAITGPPGPRGEPGPIGPARY